VFTNIRELLPKRIEALGVKERISTQDLRKKADIYLKKLLASLPNANQNVFVKNFSKNKLIIAAKNPQWAARVYLIKEDLKRNLEAENEETKIKDVVIVIEDKQ